MFYSLISKLRNTIKYTVLILAAISFLTMITYSVYVIYSDYQTKTSQLAIQYAECFEIQLDGSTKPTMLIKNSLLTALENNDVSRFDTLSRIVRMAHPAISNFNLTTDSTEHITPGYNLISGKELSYTVLYSSDRNTVTYGVLHINLSSLLQSLNFDSNVFLKDTDIYISNDDITYYRIVTSNPNSNSIITPEPVSKNYIEARLTSTTCYTDILDGELYIYTIPKTTSSTTITLFIIASIFALSVLLFFSFRMIKKYTAHTEKQLNRLVKDMDKYIKNKEDEDNA